MKLGDFFEGKMYNWMPILPQYHRNKILPLEILSLEPSFFSKKFQYPLMKNHAGTHTFDKAVRFRKVFFGIALNMFRDRSLRG